MLLYRESGKETITRNKKKDKNLLRIIERSEADLSRRKICPSGFYIFFGTLITVVERNRFAVAFHRVDRFDYLFFENKHFKNSPLDSPLFAGQMEIPILIL